MSGVERSRGQLARNAHQASPFAISEPAIATLTGWRLGDSVMAVVHPATSAAQTPPASAVRRTTLGRRWPGWFAGGVECPVRWGLTALSARDTKSLQSS